MLKNNRFIRRFFGEQYDIQHRLLNIILLVGILGVSFACLVSVIMHQNLYTQLLSFVCLILFILIFWIANSLKRSQVAIISFSVLFNNFILPCLYVTSGGIESGMPLWCLALSLCNFWWNRKRYAFMVSSWLCFSLPAD